jgi:6-phosphogluconolactonase/glucosamine-6-phosphate isomerase/deaminase
MQSRKLVRAVPLTGLKYERITLTLTVLNQAKNIFFLVLGRRKAEIVKNVLERKIENYQLLTLIRLTGSYGLFLTEKRPLYLKFQKNNSGENYLFEF